PSAPLLLSFLIILQPPTPTLFPYTTLFRSQSGGVHTNSAQITLEGAERTGHHAYSGGYVLTAGFLSVPTLYEMGGFFRQSGGKIDRKSTRLNSSHDQISYAVFCLKKKI